MAKAANPKFTFPQLALLDWLTENDKRRLFTRDAGISYTSVHYFETDGVDSDGRRRLTRVYPSDEGRDRDVDFQRRLGGRENIDVTSLCKAKFLSSYNCNRTDREVWKKFSAQFAMEFHWNDNVYLLTDAGRKYWADEGKALFEKMKAKREADAEAVDRLVVVGQVSRFSPVIPADLLKNVPKGMSLPLPSREALRPEAVCRVVKETDLRLYVTDVTKLVPVGYQSQVVTGREPNLFVDKRHVILDNADMDTARRLAEIDAEHVEDVNRIAAQAMEEILPVLLNLDARLKQKDAEREDAMHEAIQTRGEMATPSR